MRFDEPTPAEVRERMREIFERSEFRRSKSLVERFVDWLSGLFGDRSVGTGAGSAWGGPVGSIVTWVALILLVIAVVVIVYLVVRNRTPWARKRRLRAPVEVEVEDTRSASEWASDAERLEATGAWKEAIRCRYRELVARLVEAGVAAPQAGRTTGELRTDIATRLPEVGTEFSRATGLFELPWYADAPTGSSESAEFKALAAHVLERVA